MVFADEGVAGVGARGDGGEGEARVEGGRKVFERVDGEIDAAGSEGVFDFFDEDAFCVERGSVGEGCGSLEGWILHAVADGADDFDFDCVAALTKLCGDVVCLPECELRTAGADTDRVRHAMQQDNRLANEKAPRRGSPERCVRLRMLALGGEDWRCKREGHGGGGVDDRGGFRRGRGERLAGDG